MLAPAVTIILNEEMISVITYPVSKAASANNCFLLVVSHVIGIKPHILPACLTSVYQSYGTVVPEISAHIVYRSFGFRVGCVVVSREAIKRRDGQNRYQ